MNQISVPLKPVDPAVEAEMDRLAKAPVAALRLQYRELFKSEPPSAFGPDLLRRSTAHQIQENIYGGLSREAKKLLSQLVRSMALGNTGRLEVPKRIKPGSELVRVWNEQTHKVTVLAKGFAYEGAVFTSLSEIANKITGTRWNGPKFFGLRTKEKETDGKVQVKAGSKRDHRGRQ